MRRRDAAAGGRGGLVLITVPSVWPRPISVMNDTPLPPLPNLPVLPPSSPPPSPPPPRSPIPSKIVMGISRHINDPGLLALLSNKIRCCRPAGMSNFFTKRASLDTAKMTKDMFITTTNNNCIYIAHFIHTTQLKVLYI